MTTTITPDQVIAACPLPVDHPARAAFEHAVKIVVPLLSSAHPDADVKKLTSCMVGVLKAARLVQKCPESLTWPKGSEQHPLATAVWMTRIAVCVSPARLSSVPRIDPKEVLTLVAQGPVIP